MVDWSESPMVFNIENNQITQVAFDAFSEVGKHAVIVELSMRLMANKIPELKAYAHANRISETEAALLPYLVEKNLMTEAEKSHLEFSRKIRNKIFHCEFETAVKLIEELRGKPLQKGIVTGAKIDELEGKDILEKILNFASGVQSGKAVKGSFKVEESTTVDAGIFGWLLEAHAKGALNEGISVVRESVSVLDRVFNIMAKQDYENGKKD